MNDESMIKKKTFITYEYKREITIGKMYEADQNINTVFY